MQWRVGVDEAGRGPVLGDLFVAAVAIPTESPARLPDAIDDSKTISAEVRRSLVTTLEADPIVKTTVQVVTRETIDTNPGDLNELELRAFGDAIEAIVPSEQSATCIVDAPDVCPDRVENNLESRLADKIDITARHGADAAVPVTGAASLVAKQARESHVAELAETYGAVGSGYPSDPTTRAFLATYVEEHGALPGCARRSWQTAQDVLAAAEQETLTEF